MKLNPDPKSVLLHLIQVLSFSFLFFEGCSTKPQTTSENSFGADSGAQAISFLGDTLRQEKADKETFYPSDSLLEESRAIYEADSTDLNSILWYGRRLAFVHRFREAISVFTRGIDLHPGAPELYRHRGDRFITVRRPDDAITDLKYGVILAEHRKKETEPDDFPNKLDIPLSNLHFNLYYQLGLAYYFKADYQQASESFLGCKPYADNPDLLVAMTHWLYLSYRRSGKKISADFILKDIHPDMEIIENQDYLQCLLLYKGERTPEKMGDTETDSIRTTALQYGISCWYELQDHPSEADSVRRLILATRAWTTLGYIEAEADSSRRVGR